MTTLDFIASLEHGEAKAAALTVYNLTAPQWIEITDDPATLPEIGQTVIVRMDADSGGGEEYCLLARRRAYDDLRDGRFPEAWQWFFCSTAYWSRKDQSIMPTVNNIGKMPTHWRSI